MTKKGLGHLLEQNYITNCLNKHKWHRKANWPYLSGTWATSRACPWRRSWGASQCVEHKILFISYIRNNKETKNNDPILTAKVLYNMKGFKVHKVSYWPIKHLTINKSNKNIFPAEFSPQGLCGFTKLRPLKALKKPRISWFSPWLFNIIEKLLARGNND